jgi:hypothetical protein
MENSLEVPQNLKVKLPSDPEIPFSGYTSKRIKSKILKRYLHTCVQGSITHKSQGMKIPLMLLMDKENIE